ncbi:MAG: ABC transporter ATP-binding protein [Planctomycetaceae bacterium]
MPIVLSMQNVTRTFDSVRGSLTILKRVDMTLMSGSAVALRGPSGCGKTTLLHIAGTLDQPTSGIVQILGQNPWTLNERKLAEFRNRHIGFIFQEHQLLPQCSVLENVLLPTLAGFTADRKAAVNRAHQLLEKVGLQDRRSHRPAALSGGERQRVAVCRALIMEPSLLLADEPTGNLDPATAASVGQLLLEMAADSEAALLCVTHSDELSAGFPQTIHMTDQTVSFGDPIPDSGPDDEGTTVAIRRKLSR